MTDEMRLIPDEIIMSSVINACAQCGDKEGAVFWLKKMTDEMRLIPDEVTLSTVMMAIINSRRFIMKEIGAIIVLFPLYDCVLNSYCYVQMFRPCNALKDTRQALVWFDQLLREGRVRLIDIICKMFSKCSQFESHKIKHAAIFQSAMNIREHLPKQNHSRNTSVQNRCSTQGTQRRSTTSACTSSLSTICDVAIETQQNSRMSYTVSTRSQSASHFEKQSQPKPNNSSIYANSHSTPAVSAQNFNQRKARIFSSVPTAATLTAAHAVDLTKATSTHSLSTDNDSWTQVGKATKSAKQPAAKSTDGFKDANSQSMSSSLSVTRLICASCSKMSSFLSCELLKLLWGYSCCKCKGCCALE